MSKQIEVSDSTWEKIKSIVGNETKSLSEPWGVEQIEDLVGQSVYIRTVTYHQVGKVERVVGNFLVLSTASWIADSGRFMQAIQNGGLNEVEPVGQAMVNLGSVVDIFPWKHPLPTQQS